MDGPDMHIEQFIERLTGKPECGEAATHILNSTAHLVRVRSVAHGAGYCVYAARLAEAMGAVTDTFSTIPGKGMLVHQLLALALPRLFYHEDREYREDLLEGRIGRDIAHEFLEQSYNDLAGSGVVDPARFSEGGVNEALDYAASMMVHLSGALKHLTDSLGMDQKNVRLFTELPMHSYRLHMVGVVDALIEDPAGKTAVVVEWKTGTAPSVWELAQAYAYALMEADRLGYDKPWKAVAEDEYVVPVVVRPRGDIAAYSIAERYKTAGRSLTPEKLVRDVLLAAEHLVLEVTDVRKFVGGTIDEVCKVVGGRGIKGSAFRRVPEGLRRWNPRNRRDKWPCSYCRYLDACLFYITTVEEATGEDHKLAWKARFAVYRLRENALRPLKELHDMVKGIYDPEVAYNRLLGIVEKLSGKLPDSGSRVDYFEEASINPSDHVIVLRRRLRENEAAVEKPARLATLREGKPALIILNDPYVTDPLLKPSITGRIDEIKITEGREDSLEITIGAPNTASRLSLLTIYHVARDNPSMLTGVIAMETNVDLTHLELQAIDAFQRSIRKMKELGKLARKEAKETVEMGLDVLFGGAMLVEAG